MIFYYDDDPTFSNPISMSQNLAITGDVMAPNHITTQPPSSGTCPAWSACRCMLSSQCIQPRREEGPQSKAMYVEPQKNMRISIQKSEKMSVAIYHNST
jgi:hypothetical protein